MRLFRSPLVVAVSSACLGLAASSVSGADAKTAITIYSAAQPGGIAPEMYRPIPGQQSWNAMAVPGYALVRDDREMSIKQGRSQISFTDVEVPVENRLGEEGKGFAYLGQNLVRERLAIGFEGVARAQAAINFAKAGASKLWAGTVSVQPNAKTGAHHHGHLESIIYVVRGRARMRWGERLEYVAEADAGDFIYVPPYVPHQEINARTDEPLECVLVRSDQEAVVVNLEIEPAEPPEEVRWIDPNHPEG